MPIFPASIDGRAGAFDAAQRIQPRIRRYVRHALLVAATVVPFGAPGLVAHAQTLDESLHWSLQKMQEWLAQFKTD